LDGREEEKALVSFEQDSKQESAGTVGWQAEAGK